MDTNKITVTSKPTILVIIISILTMIASAAYLYVILKVTGQQSESESFMSTQDILLNVINIGVLYVSIIGLLKMKKWGLWGITITFIFWSVIAPNVTGIFIVLKGIVLVYLWGIQKKFN